MSPWTISGVLTGQNNRIRYAGNLLADVPPGESHVNFVQEVFLSILALKTGNLKKKIIFYLTNKKKYAILW